MIRTWREKFNIIVVVVNLIGIGIGGSIVWHWWFLPMWLLWISFCGGIVQVVKGGKVED